MSNWEYDNINKEWPDVQIFGPTVALATEVIQIGRQSRIDSFCKLEGGHGLSIGKFVHIASFCHLNIGGGTLRIGDHCFFASGSRVITGGNRPQGRSCSATSPKHLQILEYKETIFSDYSGCMSGAIVLPGCHFGEGAMAAAGAIVTKPIPAWEIWGGNPARFLARRDTRETLETTINVTVDAPTRMRIAAERLPLHLDLQEKDDLLQDAQGKPHRIAFRSGL